MATRTIGIPGAGRVEALEAGPLLRARELEHWAMLWISLSLGRVGRDFAFSLLKREA